MALHEELGPRDATISAIAARAGVQRLTVYRHFPDERRLFEACTSCWLDRNPLPDPMGWAFEKDPLRRCLKAFSDLYRYYESTADMWEASYRDEPHVPALKESMTAIRAYLAEIADGLAQAFPANAFVRRTIHHAVMFSTWKELAAQKIERSQIAELSCRWIQGALAGGACPPKTSQA